MVVDHMIVKLSFVTKVNFSFLLGLFFFPFNNHESLFIFHHGRHQLFNLPHLPFHTYCMKM
jgi:hypothetical protein